KYEFKICCLIEIFLNTHTITSLMPKNSRRQIMLDETKIIDQLLTNANKSINEIAKSCGFSRQKVWRIIKKLEKNNTIWGYTAVIDEEKQNKKIYILLIKRSSKPLDKDLVEIIIRKDFSKKVAKLGIKIMNSMYTNGAYDWVIYFYANDIKNAKLFVEEFNKKFEDFIEETSLLEKILTIDNFGITNPEINKIRTLFPEIF
ncbi:MAG: Lrp/AsnC family transcriptional regulator, partial [Candidatus Thermoplasmatota archaeon]|nr:Lrp/AsnC family transcriptional regulator [Candidatus Thermoplasmatota archaeon]